MMGKTHVAVGIAAGVLLSAPLEQPINLLYVAGLALGSLWPDIDHPLGNINQKIKFVRSGNTKTIFYIAISLILLYMYYLFGKSILLAPVPLLIMIGISHHRGVTHSLLGVLILVASYLWGFKPIIPYALCLGILIGSIMHIVADLFNPQGVELFYPCRKNFRLPMTIKTNQEGEQALRFFAIIVMIYQGYVMYIG